MSENKRCADLVEVMEMGIARGVFPGGVLLVRSHQNTVHESAHGRLSAQASADFVTMSTCYDLASLTKVLCATSLVLDFVNEGWLSLDERIGRILPDYTGKGRGNITITHLLEHSGGFVAWRPYYLELAAACGGHWLGTQQGLKAIRAMVSAEIPNTRPGLASLYSDLGFILLDWVLELVGGKPIQQLFQERLISGLINRNLFYIDLKDPRRAVATRRGRSFASTEKCPWRGRILIGEVHDDNAHAMGGVSGHAGLFGDAYSVADLADLWLRSYTNDIGRWDRSLVKRFWQYSRVPGSTRALGFDMRGSSYASSGKCFGTRSVGHTGFTGTSLWIDPDRELMVVLLTNRVHPTRENEAIRWFRPLLHDMVVQALERT